MASISKKVLISVMVALMSVSCGMGSVSAMKENELKDVLVDKNEIKIEDKAPESNFVNGFKEGMAQLGLANLSATEMAIILNKKNNGGAGFVTAGAVVDLAKLGVLAGGLTATIKAIQYKSQLNKLKKNQTVSKPVQETKKTEKQTIKINLPKPVVSVPVVTQPKLTTK